MVPDVWRSPHQIDAVLPHAVSVVEVIKNIKFSATIFFVTSR